ncbi:MAG: glycosyl hydrolase, partial [Sulfurimonas sp.]|nr:glycosyl hydrolase [Sulfurimonas sp.]
MNSAIKNNALILCIYTFAFALLFGFWVYLNTPKTLPEPLAQDLKLQSVSYAPFKYDESPDHLTSGLKIPSQRLDEDLELLAKHFESIRIYSVNGLEEIPFYARKHGLKVMLGIWIGAEDARNEKEIQTAIKLAKEYSDVVSCVVVGNEVLLRRELSSTKLASYITSVKQALPNTPVTYADVWEFWLKNPELSSLVDFVTIHILPYWEDTPVSVETSLAHVAQTRGEVAGILQGKDILIGETGWPSEGKMRGASWATPYAQASYLRGFLELARQNNWKYNLIEAFDQPWKRGRS